MPDRIKPMTGAAADSIQKRLAEIEARVVAATAGPWIQTWNIATGVKIWPSEHGSEPIFQVLGGIAYSSVSDADPVPQWQKNADFVRAARLDVPWLVSQLRAALVKPGETDAARAAPEETSADAE